MCIAVICMAFHNNSKWCLVLGFANNNKKVKIEHSNQLHFKSSQLRQLCLLAVPQEKPLLSNLQKIYMWNKVYLRLVYELVIAVKWAHILLKLSPEEIITSFTTIYYVLQATQCCPNFTSPEYSHSQKMKMWLLPESSSSLNGNNVLIAELESLQVRFEAEKEGRGMAITIWPFLKWFPLFPLEKCLTRNKHQAKLPVSVGPFCTGSLHTGPGVCWLINKPAWRLYNKWPLSFSAGCRITCDVYEDSRSRESPLCQCSCASSKIVLLLVMFIYQQNFLEAG